MSQSAPHALSETLAAEGYIHSAAIVCQMFQIQEATLKNLSQVLKLHPKMGDAQQMVYTQADVDRLKKAIELHRQGMPLSQIVQQLTAPAKEMATGVTAPTTTSLAPHQVTATTSTDNIATVVDAISHSKEFILSEMSRLLDDRLSGLDEVVVELIRTKSENDALRAKISTLGQEKQSLQDEIDSFKPVQFGFYKKGKK
jgi:DNA-binding transcriptional MerR regulator